MFLFYSLSLFFLKVRFASDSANGVKTESQGRIRKKCSKKEIGRRAGSTASDVLFPYAQKEDTNHFFRMQIFRKNINGASRNSSKQSDFIGKGLLRTDSGRPVCAHRLRVWRFRIRKMQKAKTSG